MPEPMSLKRLAEIRERAGLAMEQLEGDGSSAEFCVQAMPYLLAEVERLSGELAVAHVAADPFKIERVKSIVAASTRLVRIERDAERTERDRLTAFVAKLRDLAFIGGQDGETVRAWILQAFAEFDEEA